MFFEVLALARLACLCLCVCMLAKLKVECVYTHILLCDSRRVQIEKERGIQLWSYVLVHRGEWKRGCFPGIRNTPSTSQGENNCRASNSMRFYIRVGRDREVERAMLSLCSARCVSEREEWNTRVIGRVREDERKRAKDGKRKASQASDRVSSSGSNAPATIATAQQRTAAANVGAACLHSRLASLHLLFSSRLPRLDWKSQYSVSSLPLSFSHSSFVVRLAVHTREIVLSSCTAVSTNSHSICLSLSSYDYYIQ